MAVSKKKNRKTCEATVVGIIHTMENVARVFEQFKRHVRPGRTLYIEFPKKLLEYVEKNPGETDWTGYTRLINYAREQGMKIVLLDTGKFYKVSEKLIDKNKMLAIAKKVKKIAKRVGVSQREFVRTSENYGVFALRERGWLLQLREAKKGDVIVMHQEHALRVTPHLGIDYKKVVWLNRHDPTQTFFAGLFLHPDKLKKFKELRRLMREQRKQKKDSMLVLTTKWFKGLSGRKRRRTPK